MNLDRIPSELKKRPQWVVWRVEIRDGRPTKVPYCPANPTQKAKANDPTTWGTFDQAAAIWKGHKENGLAGVGFEFSQDDPYTGVDLDSCRDPQTGKMATWARKFIKQLNSYTEVSPSGRGLHILVKGKLPPGGNRKGNIEFYSHARYFTMTGLHLPETPTIIKPRQIEIEALHREIFPQDKQEAPRPPDPSLDLSDAELIDRAQQAANGEKFSNLWGGDIAGYSSASEADFALCSMLAFWCGRDPERIDRLFRQSGLYRDKWDRRTGESTYGAITIERIISQTTEIYTPDQRPPDPNATEAKPERAVPKTLIDRGLRLTDWGNAERLVALHGDKFRWCDPWSKWLVWDGRRWAEDTTREIERFAKDVIRQLHREATSATDDDVRRAIGRYAVKVESDIRQKALIAMARSEPSIPVLPEHLDGDHWLFNVLNGSLDLRTGELRPHRRENLTTKLAPVEYDSQAECPNWWKFLVRIFADNYSLIEFLQKAVGYALTGSTREQCLFFLYGLGANGKSTLMEVIHTLLGDYAHRTTSETFLVKKYGGIPNDVAALRGTRLVSALEVESGRRLSEVLIKEMTGGDRISARFLHAEWFTFKPEFKIFLAANHKPIIRGTDHAIWRRIRLIPFTVQIPDKDRDKELPEKLKAELPGILNWAIEGCLMWQDHGLDPPVEVQMATQDYREEMDLLTDFLAECCIVAPGMRAKAGDLYKAYTEWAVETGEKYPISQRKFGMSLAERGFLKERSTGNKIFWLGVGVKN